MRFSSQGSSRPGPGGRTRPRRPRPARWSPPHCPATLSSQPMAAGTAARPGRLARGAGRAGAPRCPYREGRGPELADTRQTGGERSGHDNQRQHQSSAAGRGSASGPDSSIQPSAASQSRLVHRHNQNGRICARLSPGACTARSVQIGGTVRGYRQASWLLPSIGSTDTAAVRVRRHHGHRPRLGSWATHRDPRVHGRCDRATGSRLPAVEPRKAIMRGPPAGRGQVALEVTQERLDAQDRVLAEVAGGVIGAR